MPELMERTWEDDDSSDEEHKDDEDSSPQVIEKAKEANEGGGFEKFTTTRTGRVVKPTCAYYDMATMALTQAEFGYQ
eukprot:1038319-Ditylum_brightwellii.AAC.1